MPYSAYIFDMDGTIVDNMALHMDIWMELLESLGKPTDRQTFTTFSTGKINPEILRHFVREDLTDAEVEVLSQRKEAIYRERFAAQLQEVPGLTAFLTEAARQGIKLALATSARCENVDYVLDGLNLRRFFQAMVTAEDVKNGKPDPEIFLKAAAALAVEPAACLVFEDAPNGLAAAHRAGMRAVALSTSHLAEDLAGLPGVIKVIQNFDCPVVF